MKDRILALIACLLLANSLALSQDGRVGKNHTPGLPQAGAQSFSSNACDSSAPTTLADGSTFEDSIPIYGDAYYSVYPKVGHSYAVEAWNPYGPDKTYLLNGARPALYLFNSTCSDVLAFSDVQAYDPALNLGFSDRISWIESGGGLRRIYLSNNDEANGYSFKFRITDTTLFSPRWSTYSGYLTQWGFNNVTNSDVSGVFTVFNAAGTAIKTVNVTVPTGKVKFYSSVPSDLNLPANSSGSVMFAYIGPAGAIQADSTILNSTATVIAPVKFEPRNYQH